MTGSVLSDTIRKARKQVTCDQCLRLIKVGDRYRRQVHTFDGLVVYRAHEDCDKASRELHAIADLYPDEAYMLHEYCNEDRKFLTESYPVVAGRFWPDLATP